MATPQTARWTGEFGQAYTDRNSFSAKELDRLYLKNYGVSRTQLNDSFLAGIPKDAPILEVGCNLGNQLLLLQEMGFQNLYGIEIQPYALEQAGSRLQGVQLQQASASEIPHPDDYFELVFTSGVLIHIAPQDLPKALSEIHRCSRIWIWGMEYYSPETTEVNYRGHQGLLWKMDYVGEYQKQFADLELTKTQMLPYLESSNVDSMFLLKKRAVKAPNSAGKK